MCIASQINFSVPSGRPGFQNLVLENHPVRNTNQQSQIALLWYAAEVSASLIRGVAIRHPMPGLRLRVRHISIRH